MLKDPCLQDDCTDKSAFRGYGCFKWFILGLLALLALAAFLTSRGCAAIGLPGSNDADPAITETDGTMGEATDATNNAATSGVAPEGEADSAETTDDAPAEEPADETMTDDTEADAGTAEDDAAMQGDGDAEGEEVDAAAGDAGGEGEADVGEGDAAGEDAGAAAGNIVQVAQGAGAFGTLLAAAELTELDGVLQEPGPYTIFAPTDDAFGALPDGAVNALLANPEALKQVLLHHVVPGEFRSADIGPGTSLTTAAGTTLTIGESATSATGLGIANAGIDASDIEASNGIVYVLNNVMLPDSGIQAPVIDEVGVPTFKGPRLIIVGIAEPNTQLLVELNGEKYSEITTVTPEGTWLVDGEVGPDTYNIVAYTLDDAGIPLGVSRTVVLEVTE